jgi:hypothetical protein
VVPAVAQYSDGKQAATAFMFRVVRHLATGASVTISALLLLQVIIAQVLRADSPPTRGRRSIGSGGESSSILTSVEGNAVQGRMLL